MDLRDVSIRERLGVGVTRATAGTLRQYSALKERTVSRARGCCLLDGVSCSRGIALVGEYWSLAPPGLQAVLDGRHVLVDRVHVVGSQISLTQYTPDHL
jgi:hypothetical protein